MFRQQAAGSTQQTAEKISLAVCCLLCAAYYVTPSFIGITFLLSSFVLPFRQSTSSPDESSNSGEKSKPVARQGRKA